MQEVLDAADSAVLKNMELLVRQGKSVDEAVGALELMGIPRERVERVVRYRSRVAEGLRTLGEGSVIVDPNESGVAWYTGESEGDVFWPSLRRQLLSDPKWRDAVPSIDDSSTTVVGLLADPRAAQINTRGLVVGYVQSGKTANFTATISKAADAGYRLFIVLSGVHNALRKQTQIRLDQQLHDLCKADWVQLTDEHRDFGNPVRALALLKGSSLRMYAVVKKNVNRLENLVSWLSEAVAHGGLDTCPVLIIDDEADQASPNTARDADLDRTRINELIVKLLSFHRVAYVGYTATPFANVLVNPRESKDIYPKDFIYALPKPQGYFGSEELFGLVRFVEDESEANSPHDVIRLIPTSELSEYKVTNRHLGPMSLTPSLERSLRWFVLATAARRFRDGRASHSSMLIHTSARVRAHEHLVGLIRNHIGEALNREWFSGDREEWRDLWNEEVRGQLAARYGLQEPSFDQLVSEIGAVLRDIVVLSDNNESSMRLTYATDAPSTVVVVGGNTLSRGLTLEGLICSFFLRSSNAYDSLLQMGRWFGYRPGYEDLPRIWTSASLAESFRFLAEIETEIRREIARYATEGVRPIQMPVRIRTHPQMQVTAKNKMFFAVPGEASYSASQPQTTFFAHRDDRLIRRNQDAARALITAAREEGCRVVPHDSRVVLFDVGSKIIRDFVDAFSFHEDTTMRSDLLTGYIDGQLRASALQLWNIAVITKMADGPAMDVGLEKPVSLITRSSLKSGSSEVRAAIGALMSRSDRVADLVSSSEASLLNDEQLMNLRDESRRALLLVYPIDKDSAPISGKQKHRQQLSATDHLIGVAFSFPHADPATDPQYTVQVDPILLGDGGVDAEEGEDSEDKPYQDDEGSHNEVSLG